jgi:hypothetical protein
MSAPTNAQRAPSPGDSGHAVVIGSLLLLALVAFWIWPYYSVFRLDDALGKPEVAGRFPCRSEKQGFEDVSSRVATPARILIA